MDAALLSQMSLFRFRFADCIVKIANTNWKNSLNDYIKKNFQARKLLERNHGDQNKQERGRLITKMVAITRLLRKLNVLPKGRFYVKSHL